MYVCIIKDKKKKMISGASVLGCNARDKSNAGKKTHW